MLRETSGDHGVRSRSEMEKRERIFGNAAIAVCASVVIIRVTFPRVPRQCKTVHQIFRNYQ